VRTPWEEVSVSSIGGEWLGRGGDMGGDVDATAGPTCGKCSLGCQVHDVHVL
jgi:hypothetical protein